MAGTPTSSEGVVTIDDRSTRDIDDAVVVHARPEGGWTVGVYIADVSASICKDSEWDLLAYEKTATRYYGTGNSPMLPRRFSEQELSLWPNEPKKVLAIHFTLNIAFQVVVSSIFATEVTSQDKLAYADIPTILRDKEHKHHTMLTAASSVAFGLLERRRQSGAMVLYDLNNGWITTEEGFLKQIQKHEETVGQIIIQELMIAANRVVGEFAIENNIPFLYRNHSARTAAPSREDLMTQISEAFRLPIQGLDLVRQRVHLLLEKAEYGPLLKGHYGLNLPAYTHFTSPIRRYADLVNHRQIKAFLASETYLYDNVSLGSVGDHINTVTREELAARSDYMKDAADSRAERAGTDARRIEGLNHKEFERVLKVQLRNGAPTEALMKAYTARLQANKVLPVCLAVTLIECPDVEVWRPLLELVFERLKAHPEDGVAILMLATQGYEWPEPRYDVIQSGPPHAPSFTATVYMQGTQATATGPTAKAAKQRAAVTILANRYGFDVSTPIEQNSPKAETPAFDLQQDGKDPITLLHEYSQAKGLPMPDYAYQTAGPPHAPIITCCATFEGIQRQAVGSSKKESKRQVAQAMLVALRSN